jgi:5-methylcytosine-specific restriction endonuclease McrA
MYKCKNCGAVLPTRQDGQRGRDREYCNRFCYKLAKGFIKFAVKPDKCLWCQVDLNQENRPGMPKRFCCKQHSGFYYDSLKPKKIKTARLCEFCSQSFFSAIDAARFCSVICRAEGTKQERRAERAKQREANPRRFDYDCDRCDKLVVTDKMVTKGSYGRYCRVCALQLRRERYRVKTARRQKVMNPVRISVDFLIERDGVICHLCQQPVDPALPRNDRMGATIDHVIPLSKGGVDELDNLKLAHWICNIRKGNRNHA